LNNYVPSDNVFLNIESPNPIRRPNNYLKIIF
jgi:hypothetical protein